MVHSMLAETEPILLIGLFVRLTWGRGHGQVKSGLKCFQIAESEQRD